MEWVKAHVLLTIAASQAAGYAHAPYFPIEISRTAASSPLALLVFRAGATATGLILWVTSTLTWVTALLWAGFLLTAWVPDTLHLGVHMAGPGLMVAACALRAWETDQWAWLLGPLALYALRLPPIGWVLSEGGRILDWAALRARHHAVMFEGAEPALRGVFKVAAVLQWTCFAGLSALF